jgi:Holliday junction resolvase
VKPADIAVPQYLRLPPSYFDEERASYAAVSAGGAHHASAAAAGQRKVFYWREKNVEVDVAARAGTIVLAIEVKSGRRRDTQPDQDIWEV